MACPRCGCRMISKLGKGNPSRLICADCGLDLSTKLAQKRPQSAIAAQVVTIALISMFGVTAMALMVIKDLRPQGQTGASANNLNLKKTNTSKRSMRWIVIPRLPNSQ